MRLLLAVVAVSLSGCAWFDLTRMEPGEDCLTCHHPGGKAKKHAFTLAGTIYGSATPGTASSPTSRSRTRTTRWWR
jgi:hypothetical protein